MGAGSDVQRYLLRGPQPGLPVPVIGPAGKLSLQRLLRHAQESSLGQSGTFTVEAVYGPGTRVTVKTFEGGAAT